MDQPYSMWQVNTDQPSGNGESPVIANAAGRHLRVVNIVGQNRPTQLIEAMTPTGTGTAVFTSATNGIYQHHPGAAVMAEPILLQIPETRQYIVDESSIQNIDQMPPVNLIMGTGADANDESSLVTVTDSGQVFHLPNESNGETTDGYDSGGCRIMQPNDTCEQPQYAEECQVMEEVITDDWVQSQGEECVQVTVDQLGASTVIGTVEDDISVPLDQDQYTLSRPFPCDFCSRRFRKKATLMNHLVAHSNERPHVCNLCGAQYGRRIDLTNHFKQHAYASSNLDETALRSDPEVDYDMTGLPMQHPSKHRPRQSSEDDDLFNEGTRAVSYNSQPPMQLISSTNSPATSTYTCDSAVRLQYSNNSTIASMNAILEDGSYPYVQPMGEIRVGSSRKAHPSEMNQPKRQASRTAKPTASKGNRRNAANNHIKKETIAMDEALFVPPDEEATTQQSFPVLDERKPFVCQQCGVSFGREKALASHSRVHGGDMQYPCTKCNERFWDRLLLQDHIRKKHPDVYLQFQSHGSGPKRSTKTHTTTKSSSSFVAEEIIPASDECFRVAPIDGQYVCDSCHMVFDRPEQVKKHIKLAHDATPGTCSRTIGIGSDRMTVKQELCEMLFDVMESEGQRQDELESEFTVDDEDEQSRDEQSPLFCRDCGKTFAKSSDLQAHNTKEHASQVEPHECQLCGEKFVDQSVIKQHVQEYHRGELTDSSCAICGKLCKNQTSLMKHSYDHSRERAHSCSKCGKTFHHMGRLKRHMGSHRNKTVCCEVCGEEFPDGRTLMNHRHSHSKSNNYPCNECGKTFGSRSSQQIHLRIHTGERPYACRFCWKAFADGGTLRKHERVHTGEKPYGCSVCPKEFNQRVVLREHIRAHHSQPDNIRGNPELPYYCPVCSTLFGTAVDLVQHLIEHSDSNTAKKRKPPTFPRKYKRRRKLKPHELERLQSGRRKQKGQKDVAGDDHEGSPNDEEDDDAQYERTMSLERDDGTLKTSSEIFLEYGDSSKAQKLAVASSKFISPYELLGEETVNSRSNRAHKNNPIDGGMLDDIGINLLTNGDVYSRADLDKGPETSTSSGSSKLNNNEHAESPNKRRGARGGTAVPSKAAKGTGKARMIRTEPAKRTPVAKSKSDGKRIRKRTATAINSTKEPLFVVPKREDASTFAPAEMNSVSHAMEAFSELEKKRSRARPMTSYVREIPSSKISENFPLLDDGDTEDTMEEQLMDGCSDERPSRPPYGSRQRYISSTSTVSATRDEEDEQLLMEISRGAKYTDRFNSDIVNDLAEILRSPLKGTPGTTATSVPPVDILASPTSRHAVLLPPIQQKALKQHDQDLAFGRGKSDCAKKAHAASHTSQVKAKVQNAPSKRRANASWTSSNAITTTSIPVDPYTTSLLYSHGRRLTRGQLELEVNFLSEAFAPEKSHPERSNVTDETTPEDVSTFSKAEERPVYIKQENVNVPEKLAEMLLNDGIAPDSEAVRSNTSERPGAQHCNEQIENVLLEDSKEERQHGLVKTKQESNTNNSGVSPLPTTSNSPGYRCSICAACFADRSQLILHVPVHM